MPTLDVKCSRRLVAVPIPTLSAMCSIDRFVVSRRSRQGEPLCGQPCRRAFPRFLAEAARQGAFAHGRRARYPLNRPRLRQIAAKPVQQRSERTVRLREDRTLDELRLPTATMRGDNQPSRHAVRCIGTEIEAHQMEQQVDPGRRSG